MSSAGSNNGPLSDGSDATIDADGMTDAGALADGKLAQLYRDIGYAGKAKSLDRRASAIREKGEKGENGEKKSSTQKE